MHHILITGALHPSALDAFKKNPTFRTQYLPDCSRADLLKNLKDTHVLVTRSETDVDKQVIDAAPALKVIARAAVGVGNIDIDYATEKGLLVINCPGKNTNSAAELTLALMLAMFRKVPEAHQKIKSGGWDRHRFTGSELRGKRIGIVGLGNVGHRVAKFARGFDMEVFAYDPYIAPTVFEQHGAKPMKSLREMMPTIDILTVHVPLNKETKGMITGELMDLMPTGSYVINAARGGIFREVDLIERLKSGKILGAGIDTFESEPKPNSELLALPNVYVTPHIGASTVEAQIAIGETVYQQVVKALEGGVVDYPVNLPSVGIIDNPLLKAYALLAEKLGALVGQMIDFNPAQVEISYRGDLAGAEHGLIRLSWMKGYASQVVNDYVSFVNADAQMQKLGIKISEKDDPSFVSYRSAVKIKVLGAENRALTVGGIVFDQSYVRISLINDFYFEVEPSGLLLLVENEDKPGVVGDLGHFLAMNQINIDSFELSRNRKGGKAMAMIKIDNDVTAEQIDLMKRIRNVTNVRSVRL